MNGLVSGFLDAPLLLDMMHDAFLRLVRHDRLVREMYSMSDHELRDMRLTRADIPKIIAEAGTDEVSLFH